MAEATASASAPAILEGADYITVKKIAEKAGVSRATIYAHIERGNLTVKKVGFYTVIEAADAIRFLKRLRTIRLGNRDIVIYQ